MKIILDYNYRGLEIHVYRQEDEQYTVDIKHPCGEPVIGWTDLPTIESAESWAKGFITALLQDDKDSIHTGCKDEYCNPKNETFHQERA